MQELYNCWMMNDANKEFTANGNPRPPSMDVYLEWIVIAWESLSKQMISKSFLVCGIANSHSGDKDDFINCFKPHGPVPERRQMLEEARAGINTVVAGMEENDEEEEDENGYVSDKSLELIGTMN